MNKINKFIYSSFILLGLSNNLYANTYNYTNEEIIVEKSNKLENKIKEYNHINYVVPKEVFYTKVTNFYRKMKDVKYVFGGTSMKGIDCSAFIRKFYEDEFNVKLTRSTHTQVYEGIPIKKNELKLGDLIFFKEKNRVSNHVGIYIGKGKIIHSSSTQKGVAIDDLSKFDNIYWTSRRVLDIQS